MIMYLQSLNILRRSVPEINGLTLGERLMFEECPAELKMTQTILKDSEFDEVLHQCKIIRYIPEEERIYLLSGKTDLPSYSLDGIYDCVINAEEKSYVCSGIIEERYWSRMGKVIVFWVKNGFYKNNLN